MGYGFCWHDFLEIDDRGEGGTNLKLVHVI